MVDYIWETEVLVMFLVGEQCIGRAAFKRKTPDTPVTKLRIFNFNVKSVLLYGCETWRTTKTMQQKIQTFLNTCLRRIFNIRWPEKIRNEELWERAGQEPVAKQILRRKWGWIGHTLRKPASSTTRQALTWNPQGKRKRGRPRNSWRRDTEAELCKQGTNWTGVARLAQNRNPALKKWLSGEEVTLEGNGKTVIHGKATSIQAPYCFKEKFLEIDSPPQVKNVTSLGVGILFTQQDFRQPQSVIVYFTSNSYPFHKTVFKSRPGGVFPTVTFPTNGGKFSVKTNTYPMVPDTMRSAWLDNVKTAATPADSSSEGTFSLLTKRTFRKDKTSMSSSQQNRSQDEEVETGVTETTFDGSSKKEVIATATGYKYKASIPIKMASGKVELTEDENGDVVIRKDGETVTKLKDKTPLHHHPRHSTNITLIRSQYCDHNSYKSGREDGTCCNKRQGRGI
nr:hypothetical protein BaRGS_015654 [Batillaria attramentaria]